MDETRQIVRSEIDDEMIDEQVVTNDLADFLDLRLLGRVQLVDHHLVGDKVLMLNRAANECRKTAE